MSDAMTGSVQTTEAAPPVTAISLEGPHVRLRPVTMEDYGFLWECRCHPDIQYLWMQGRTLPTFEQYTRDLNVMLGGAALAMLMIETTTDPRPIGFVFAYDHNPYDKYAFWSIALHPAFTRIGWGVEATVLFYEYLFTYFDLRMLYSDHYAFNQRSMTPLTRVGARVEGHFVQQRYYQGAFHDVIRLCSPRNDWYQLRPRLVKYLIPRSGPRHDGSAPASADQPDGGPAPATASPNGHA